MSSDDVLSNSVINVCCSLEAVALRLRQAVGLRDLRRTLEWAEMMLEGLQGEAHEIAEEAPEHEPVALSPVSKEWQ